MKNIDIIREIKEKIKNNKKYGWILTKFYDRTGFQIINSDKELLLFENHELKKEFEKFKQICPILEN